MRRFVVRHNIDRFESQLASATDPQDRLFLQSLIDDARHELAGLEQLWRISCPNLGISSGLGKEGEEILDHAVQAHQADFGTLQIWNDISSSLCLIAQTNFDNTLIECFPETREGDDTVCASALKSKSMVSVSDLEVSDLFSSLAPWARTVGIRSVVASPVVGQTGKCVGVHSLYFRRPHLNSSSDIQLLSTYGAKFRDLFLAMGHV